MDRSTVPSSSLSVFCSAIVELPVSSLLLFSPVVVVGVTSARSPSVCDDEITDSPTVDVDGDGSQLLRRVNRPLTEPSRIEKGPFLRRLPGGVLSNRRQMSLQLLSPSVFISRCGNRAVSPPCHQDNCRWRVCVFVVFVVTQTPAAVTQTVVSGVVLGRLICPSPFFFHYERLSDLLVVTNSSANRERSPYSAPYHQAPGIAWRLRN